MEELMMAAENAAKKKEEDEEEEEEEEKKEFYDVCNNYKTGEKKKPKRRSTKIVTASDQNQIFRPHVQNESKAKKMITYKDLYIYCLKSVSVWIKRFLKSETEEILNEIPN